MADAGNSTGVDTLVSQDTQHSEKLLEEGVERCIFGTYTLHLGIETIEAVVGGFPDGELPCLHAGHPLMCNRQPVLLEIFRCSRNVRLLQQRALLLEDNVGVGSCHRTEYREKTIPLTGSDTHLIHRDLTRHASQHTKQA